MIVNKKEEEKYFLKKKSASGVLKPQMVKKLYQKFVFKQKSRKW